MTYITCAGREWRRLVWALPWAVVLAAGGRGTLAAQAPGDRAAVLEPVHQLFDAMRRGDSAAARAVFHPEALLATALIREGRPALQVDTLDGFIDAVGTPHDEVWDERLSEPEVRIDGPLASVWAEYAFYAGTRFSHCGVNAFQLARSGERWRIIALTDTRRREGCRGGGK